MKKLFIKETDEVVEFGDTIFIEFTNELEDGEVVVKREFTLTPATAALLNELGILEWDDAEEDLIDFNEDAEECCEELGNLYEEVGELEARVTELEDSWDRWGEELKAALIDLKAVIKEKEEPKAKTASPKKK